MYAENRANLNTLTDTRRVNEGVSQWAMEKAGGNTVASVEENMNQDAYNQYKQSSYEQIPEPGNPTYTEAWALVEAARRMASPLEYGDLNEEKNRVRVRESLRLNWRLWTIFQTELSLEDGPVPTEIRESMLNLCNFVDRHTVDTINAPTPEKIATLIEINRNIANGLLTSLQNALDSAEAEEGSEATAELGTPSEAPSSIDTDA